MFGLSALYTKLLGGLAGLLMLFGLYGYHKHAVSSAYDRGKADEAEHIKAKALAIKEKADALSLNISQLIRSQTDAENDRIHSSAGTLILRGPGRAICPGAAGLPAAAGGSQPAGGPAHAALPRVPYPDGEQLIGMPFAPTVGFAEQHDLNRTEVIAWRGWYKRQSDAWPKPEPEKKRRSFLGLHL